MWDSEREFYFDYHINSNKPTNCLSLAAVYPLYFKMADQNQAAFVAQTLKDHFLKDGGLITTTTKTGQQWDAPNGWAPLQWMAVAGLKNYGFDTLADDIRQRWLDLNERVYKETGKMVEKYNVSDTQKKGGGGEYPLQDGFGWTNGVFSALSDL
jgi:alpha,alpha-trehalase